jgi:lysophospholipase L1-like esterase
MKRNLVFFVLASLYGCGGSSDPASNPSGTSSAAAASTPAATTSQSITLDAEGDSTMKGAMLVNGTYIFAQLPAPAVDQAQLIEALGTENLAIENNGVVGETVGEDVSGWAGFAPLATRLAVDPSKIVLENYGMNDSLAISVQAFHDNLVAWIAVVRQAGKIPVLEEPNPSSLSYYTQLPAFAAMVDQVGYEQKVLVIQQYNYVLSLPNWQSMLTDGIHPNQALYILKGQREASYLQPLVANNL